MLLKLMPVTQRISSLQARLYLAQRGYKIPTPRVWLEDLALLEPRSLSLSPNVAANVARDTFHKGTLRFHVSVYTLVTHTRAAGAVDHPCNDRHIRLASFLCRLIILPLYMVKRCRASCMHPSRSRTRSIGGGQVDHGRGEVHLRWSC
jgi:hypothetical protein